MAAYKIIHIVSVSLAVHFSLAGAAMANDAGAKAMFYGMDANTVVVNTGDAPKVDKVRAPRTHRTPSRPTQLTIMSWVKLMDETGGATNVSPNRNFNSGERIRLNFKTNKPGYLYVANIGTSGNVTMLFPRSGQQNFVKPDLLYEVPDSAGKSIRFDDNPGVEEVLVVLSPDPLDTLTLDGGREVPTDGRGVAQERVRSADAHRMTLLASAQDGAKDLLLEDDSNALFATNRSVGSTAAKTAVKPIVLKLKLRHGS